VPESARLLESPYAAASRRLRETFNDHIVGWKRRSFTTSDDQRGDQPADKTKAADSLSQPLPDLLLTTIERQAQEFVNRTGLMPTKMVIFFSVDESGDLRATAKLANVCRKSELVRYNNERRLQFQQAKVGIESAVKEALGVPEHRH
jgi:hypothetical protein